MNKPPKKTTLSRDHQYQQNGTSLYEKSRAKNIVGTLLDWKKRGAEKGFIVPEKLILLGALAAGVITIALPIALDNAEERKKEAAEKSAFEQYQSTSPIAGAFKGGYKESEMEKKENEEKTKMANYIVSEALKADQRGRGRVSLRRHLAENVLALEKAIEFSQGLGKENTHPKVREVADHLEKIQTAKETFEERELPSLKSLPETALEEMEKNVPQDILESAKDLLKQKDKQAKKETPTKNSERPEIG